MLFMTQDARPVLRCGICDVPILRSELAMICFPLGIEAGHLHRVSLSHTGECQHKAMQYLENDLGPAQSMAFAEYVAKLLEDFRAQL